jgi:tetratricopeptide (TPR) repeat protein
MIATRFVAIAVVVALFAGLHPAAAETRNPADAEARRRFADAEIDYKAGRYAEALVKYQWGYNAKPLPGFLVNIAQCQRRLGDLKAARATYREFVLVAPDSRLVPEVRALIGQLDAVIADLAAGGNGAGAADVGSGDDVHTSELAAAPMLSPAAPEATTPLIAATPPAEPREPAEPARHSRTRWWIWGGVAAAAIAGGIVAGLALSSPETTTIHAGSLGTLRR